MMICRESNRAVIFIRAFYDRAQLTQHLFLNIRVCPVLSTFNVAGERRV